MIILSIVFAISHVAVAKEKSGKIVCGNPPAQKWSTYYCLSADFKGMKQLYNVSYGLCNGSIAAGEEEPENIFEFDSIRHDSSLAATSKAWKSASVFNLPTEIGSSVIFLNAETFNHSNHISMARLKVNSHDIRLKCHTVLD